MTSGVSCATVNLARSQFQFRHLEEVARRRLNLREVAAATAKKNRLNCDTLYVLFIPLSDSTAMFSLC